MSRPDQERFDDILRAIERCQHYAPFLQTGELADMAYDAVLRNLAVIGEAVRALSEQTRAEMPEIPWPAIAGLRNVVIHEYFRVDRALILDIVENQLGPMADRLKCRVDQPDV
ncbi:DUF86 domain-containing protein [Ornithinimicrobium murale]|uniref:HepT-like ribonuclease domain-containing protein n=1 Tax=Ornithinimicrobium murale TaxID=1050153 RepID=UPI000E0DED05|nr:HepT-like ribonuclease domain-containing protein [Ornithinimicrobium murale]